MELQMCNLKTMSNVLCGWKQKTLIELSGWAVGGVVFQGCWRIYFLVFLFLACFVVLQVIVEWSWWAGFSDGARSWLLNGYSLWAVWIIGFVGGLVWSFQGNIGVKTFRPLLQSVSDEIVHSDSSTTGYSFSYSRRPWHLLTSQLQLDGKFQRGKVNKKGFQIELQFSRWLSRHFLIRNWWKI